MAQDERTPKNREKRKVKLSVWLTIPMLMMVLLMLVIFFTVLSLGGEFRYVEQYAYGTLSDKTENRRNYIEAGLQEKVPVVQESAERVGGLVERLLSERGASVSDLQTDRELSRQILETSVDTVVDLLRRGEVNDAYLILDTGDLYAIDNVSTAKAALYLRDLDVKTDGGYSDLLMEVGFTSISRDFGITRDSGWTLYFMPDMRDEEGFDFYYKTLETARQNPQLASGDLGYWSGFSRLSRTAATSMKYSMPLVASDGTVYGIIGVGLTENTILASLPTNDLQRENACYVLGLSHAGNQFDVMTHSGSAFSQLVGNVDSLQIANIQEGGICDFALRTDADLTGSVQYIGLYGQNSPYRSEQWALIAVADRAGVLRPLTSLQRMLLIAALVSLAVGVIVVILSCRRVVRPITNAIKLMRDESKYRQVIRFQPSNIFEFDKMTDAITQLQINVRSFSSRVSKMIRVADVGLGTFMYDRTDDSVFVGQSLQKLLQLPTEQDEDVTMSREEFLNGIFSHELRLAIAESLKLTTREGQAEFSGEYSIEQENGQTLWVRLSLIYTQNNSIGILQDITDTVLEKKRIEYERDYDGLTGLLNRRAYYQRVEALFRDRNALKVTAFVIIDLDNLKYINDTYGHDLGDDYIRTTATILKQFQSCGGIISRISGDEFNICLPHFSSKDEIREIVQRVHDQLMEDGYLMADGTHFKIRASVGVAWYPDDADSYELLIKYADFAMYTIKHSTKGEVSEFDKNAYAADAVLLEGVEEMNRIIDEVGVKYAFQSIISAKTGEVYGYEALMRVQSTIFQSPLELLRAAKTGAKLYEIERMTWTQALADFQTQIDGGRIDPSSHIFINSIANSAMKPSDAETIEAAHPDLLSRIVLEILESEAVNEEFNARKMSRLKKWGGQIALDDFGTGYNSEYALISLQPNIIKIDRSIISGCDTDVSRRMIIKNLVCLARTKDIYVLAEGVETEGELRTVIACGVDLLQGYYFSRPLFEPQPLPPEMTRMIWELAHSNSEPGEAE